MKIYRILLISLSILLILTGCSEDGLFNLDKEPQDIISDAAVFKDEILTEAYLAQIYEQTRFFDGGQNLNAPSGWYLVEGMGAELRTFAYWQIAASFPLTVIDENGAGAMDYWPYTNIRSANDFIMNIQEADFDQDFIEMRMSEARWLRAWMYFQMVIRYGGVPIITVPQDVDDPEDEINVARNSEKEVYDFIASEMDDIAAILPDNADKGRVSKWAALALKSRAMLFAASVGQFDGTTQLDGLLGIPSGDAAAYWQASYNASKDIIDEGPFSLYNKYPDDRAHNYHQLFIDESGNPEVIFVEQFDVGMGRGVSYGIGAIPFEFRASWGSNFCPFLNLVDEFEYIDGSPGYIDRDLIDSDHLFDIDSLFGRRDPRFVASFFTPETPWQDGVVRIHKSTVKDGEELTSGTVGDEGWPASAPKRNWQNTGFMVKKRLDETELGPIREGSDEDYIVFRYGEILLNLAEAAFYLGYTGEALDNLNLIRERAGMPLLTNITEEDIRHERQVELVFEEKRYWDFRRWRIAVEKLDGLTTKGLQYVYYFDEDKYDLILKNGDPSARVVQERHYYYPLGVNRIADNPNLVENPGY
jgi:hypothetical protein